MMAKRDDGELEGWLRELNVPPPRPDHLEKVFEQARQAFTAARPLTQANRRRRPRTAAWGALGLAAVLAVVFLFTRDVPRSGKGPVREPQAGPFSDKDWRRIIAEVQGLFPERLQAVVATNGNLGVRLHPEPTHSSDQAIFVSLHGQDGPAIELVSFSGEVVEVDIADSLMRLELLLTASSDVLLTGNHFFWTRRDSAGLGTVSIRARPLENGA